MFPLKFRPYDVVDIVDHRRQEHRRLVRQRTIAIIRGDQPSIMNILRISLQKL